MIPHVVASHSNEIFFLKHIDDKGDHIMVDEECNITGIIDWEFASAEPKSLAFRSPAMMWPVGDFYDGKNNVSLEELEFATMVEKRVRTDRA